MNWKEQIKKVKKPKMILGIVGLVIARFIPVYKLDFGIGSKWMSLSQLREACNLVSGLAEGCGMVNFFNIVFWILFFGLLLSILFANKENINNLVKKYLKSLK